MKRVSRVKITVLRGDELSPDLARRWASLQEADPRYSSPYLSPEYTALVAAVQPEARVAVLEQDGEVVGFFPFQQSGPREAVPMGDDVSDVQAVVAAPHARWTADGLLRACGLERWRFNNLLTFQDAFRPCHEKVYEYVFMDLSRGYEVWRQERRAAGSSLIRDVERRRRRLEQMSGPLRFEAGVADPAALRRLMRLKSEQYLRTGRWDRFAVPWIAELIERVHACPGPRVSGILSVLYAGSEIVAAHLGMRYGPVWHSWFPAYDVRFAAASPGLILDLEMAKAAESLGASRIDLGRKGPHKQRLASRTWASVATGCARI